MEGNTVSSASIISHDYHGCKSCYAKKVHFIIQEAAIHVSKGADSDASLFHCPKGYWSKKAFKILHHPIYYVIHLTVSLLLMFLAPIETEILDERNKITLLVSIKINARIPYPHGCRYRGGGGGGFGGFGG